MRIGGLQKFSMLDYPSKLACIIFTQGCNLRCRFCYNPELVLPEKFDKPISEDYVFDFLKKRKNVLNGVVITGGEPTIHSDLPDFLDRIRKIGYSIKLNTNGLNPSMLNFLIASHLIDYIAMDVKAPLNNYDVITCNAPQTDNIKASIELILNAGIKHEFRTTVFKLFHSKEDLQKIIETIGSAQSYCLQKGILTGKILDPSIAKTEQYDDNDIAALKESVEFSNL